MVVSTVVRMVVLKVLRLVDWWAAMMDVMLAKPKVEKKAD
jgi:hypothetical protein